MIVRLENSNFDEEISNGLVLVDFYADWCGPCKMMDPVLEEVSKQIKVVKINIDQHQDIASTYQIMSIPNLILFKDGKPIKQNIGFMPLNSLLSWTK